MWGEENTPPNAPAAPTAQLVGIEPIESTGASVVADAVERHARVDWLAVKIRQRQSGTEPHWTAEGILQRGPNGCTRLTMSYRNGDNQTHSSEMICDGRVLAQVIHRPGRGPEINGWELPATAEGREEILNKYGCGGPSALLRHLAGRIPKWEVRRLRQGDRLRVQTTGVLVEQPEKETFSGKIPAQKKVIRLSFDASTLWLDRVEWWSDLPEAGGRLLWEQEYLDPRIGQALSLEECARVFSYQGERGQ
jgi:hypothetical protein